MRPAKTFSAPMREALAALEAGARLHRLRNGSWSDGVRVFQATTIAALIRGRLVRVTERRASREALMPSAIELETGAVA